jgi:hypothetical protein
MPGNGGPVTNTSSKRYADHEFTYHSLLSKEDPLGEYGSAEEPRNGRDPSVSNESIHLSTSDLTQGHDGAEGNRDSKDLSDQYTIEEDLDVNGDPTTILLPPLEVRTIPIDQVPKSDSPTSRNSRRSSGSKHSGESHFSNGNKPSVVISPAGIDILATPCATAGNCLSSILIASAELGVVGVV